MNDIYDFLKFTTEIGEDFEDGYLPSLDLKIKVEKLRIIFEFSEKPMAFNLVVHAGSALSQSDEEENIVCGRY